MKGDKVLFNGVPRTFGDDMAPDELLGRHFVKHQITVFGRRVVGGMFEQEAVKVLDINGYPAGGGAVVAAYVWDDMTMVSVARQLPWRDFFHTKGLTELPADFPVFAVVRGCVVALPFGNTIQRELGLAACRAAGLAVEERTLRDGEELEELFAVTPAGIASVQEAGGKLLPHSLAARILRALNTMV